MDDPEKHAQSADTPINRKWWDFMASGVQDIMFFPMRGALGLWSSVSTGAIRGDTSANPAGFFPASVIMCAVLPVSLVVGAARRPQAQG